MSENKDATPRVKVIEPEYPGKVIRDLPDEYLPDFNTISLSDSDDLARALHAPPDVVKWFMRERLLHEGMSAETDPASIHHVTGGLCCEDLATLGLVAHFIVEYETPRRATIDLAIRLRRLLLTTPKNHRVVVIVQDFRAPRGPSGRLVSAANFSDVAGQVVISPQAGPPVPLEIEPEVDPYTAIYGASLLRDEIEVRLLESPFKTPGPRWCIVKY